LIRCVSCWTPARCFRAFNKRAAEAPRKSEVLEVMICPSGSSMEQLPNLKGCQVHTSVMLSEVDIKIYKCLGVDLTSEPIQTTKKRY